MTDKTKVYVIKYKGRCWVLRWFDRRKGKWCNRTSGCRKKPDAQRKALELEAELRANREGGGLLDWLDFTIRYGDEVLSGLAPKTGSQLRTVFRAVERIIAPKLLGDVTAAELSKMATRLREEGKAEITIRNYLAHLKAALRWAADLGLIAAVPAFPKTPRAAKASGGGGKRLMKGRPIAAEEFDRMVAAVPAVLSGDTRAARDARRKAKEAQGQDGQPKRRKVPDLKPLPVAPEAIGAWRFYLRGLWWSGLRLRESLSLRWDHRPDAISVDLSGRRPMLRIPGGQQKNAKAQLHPMAPEFAELLAGVPESERHGRVFKLVGFADAAGRHAPLSDPDWVSRMVSRMGREAGVKVSERTKRDRKTGEARAVVKFASAHDLRRSFGFRWSRRIMPPRLRELMRHADIQTTMAYYVGLDADDTADALWEAFRKQGELPVGDCGNVFGNTGPDLAGLPTDETTQALEYQGLAEYTPLGSNQ